AAVGESEEKRKPERFSGHRKAVETDWEHSDAREACDEPSFAAPDYRLLLLRGRVHFTSHQSTAPRIFCFYEPGPDFPTDTK
ncbi:MAG: hypothetical protein IJG58_01135, partial [Oscillospiraceae bacterium]|nr:hypothetical protein [Oscillospiraceae bacterium]